MLEPLAELRLEQLPVVWLVPWLGVRPVLQWEAGLITCYLRIASIIRLAPERGAMFVATASALQTLKQAVPVKLLRKAQAKVVRTARRSARPNALPRRRWVAKRSIASVRVLIQRATGARQVDGEYETLDANGKRVVVGDSVRVLHVRASVLNRLDADGKAKILSLKGAVLPVYEIDEWGGAWVRQEWVVGKGRVVSHSLMLTSADMALVG